MQRYKALACLVSLLALVAIHTGSAQAQKQTDVALSVFDASGGGLTAAYGGDNHQQLNNGAGGLFELRQIHNSFIGYEVTYSFNHASQVWYGPLPFCPVGFGTCSPPPPESVSANAHEITGDWLVSIRKKNLRPFALIGAGVLLTEPTTSEPTNGSRGTMGSQNMVYVYGVGLDWQILPRLGLRAQFRGNVHKVPDIAAAFNSPSFYTQTVEPAIGVYYKF